MSKTKQLAKILPSNLSESAIQEISDLVNAAVEEKLAKEVKLLEAKVGAFMRHKIEELKQHALTELENENDTFRGARLFETIKGMVAGEIDSKDKESVISEVNTENKELQKELETLRIQYNSILNDQTLVEGKLGNLHEAYQELQEEKKTLEENNKTLEETKKKPFHSSERAVVITEDVDNPKEKQKVYPDNPFLNEEIINLSKLEY